MNSSKQPDLERQQDFDASLKQKIAVLEKQLQWEKPIADAIDTMINIAEK